MQDTERDTLRRFLFEHAPIRGEAVRLDASWRAILERHDYPPAVRQVLGEMMAASALLSSTLKFDGTFTMQIQSNGPVSLLVMEATSERTLRGMAKWDAARLGGASLRELIGDGILVITIDPTQGKERYQGVVEIRGESLADSLEHYLAHSEQLDTRLWLAADDQVAAGLLLQRLPGEMSEEERETWERAGILAHTLTPQELRELSGMEVIHRLFHEEDLRVFDPEPVAFRCTCSRERVSDMLRRLGREEVREIIEEQGAISVTCEFCLHHYRYDRVDAEQLFAEYMHTDTAGKSH